MQPAFFLVYQDDQIYISSPKFKVKIDVFDFYKEGYEVTPGKIEFYYTSPHRSLALVAELNERSLDHISAALKWFANYIKIPDANFTFDPPSKSQLSVI